MADTAAAGVCHIHPPAVDGQPPELIGPYADATRCERERRLRFGPAGRCHCTAAFTPDWLSPNAANPRSPAGGDRRLPTAGGEHPVPLP